MRAAQTSYPLHKSRIKLKTGLNFYASIKLPCILLKFLQKSAP